MKRFRERVEHLERVSTLPKINSGPPADVQLLPPQKLSELRRISAIQALTRRGVQALVAKILIENLIEGGGPVAVHVPHVEWRKKFAHEMAASGVQVRFVAPSGEAA